MIQGLLSNLAIVERRVSTGVDTLGNPTYGDPVTGSGWNTVYTNMPCRFAFSDQKIQFALAAERVEPSGTMYYNPNFEILPEDRIIDQTSNNQYVVRSTRVAYKTGSVIDHLEAELNLP